MATRQRKPAKRSTKKVGAKTCGGGTRASADAVGVTVTGMMPRTQSKIHEDIALTKRLNRVGAGILSWLGVLQTYEVTYRFEERLEEEVDSEQYTAQLQRRYPYRQLFITWSREKLRVRTDDELRGVIMHEAFHEILFGDFERHLDEKLNELPLAATDIAELAAHVTEWSEDVIDRMTHQMMRSWPSK